MSERLEKRASLHDATPTGAGGRGASADVATGLLLVLVGTACVAIARGYERGSTLADGAGFFPTATSAGLLLAGAALLARGMALGGEKLGAWPLRQCVAVTASVLTFTALIGSGGLIPAVTAAVLVAAIGSGTARLPGAALLAVALALGVSLLFVGLLRQPLDLLPRF